MFTDVYFTNLTPSSKDTRVAFFQKNVAAMVPCGTVFKVIEKCQHRWTHVVRIPWDLNFRLVRSSGNTTPAYHLKTTFSPVNKKFLIWKEGILTVKQDYGNGKQIIDFEQIKGDKFSSVRFYRGELLIAEVYFRGKYAQFQIDSNISITENHTKNEMDVMVTENREPSLDFDLTGIKALYVSVNKQIANKLMVYKTEKW